MFLVSSSKFLFIIILNALLIGSVYSEVFTTLSADTEKSAGRLEKNNAQLKINQAISR